MTDRFQCTIARQMSEGLEETVKNLNLQTPEALHFDSTVLAGALEQDCLKRGGRIWCLPLCNTLEAECLGAKAKLSFSGALIHEPPYTEIGEVPVSINLSNRRVRVMWEAMDRLSVNKEYHGAYKLTGPLTVLSSLIPMSKVYKAMRRGEGEDLFQRVENMLLDFAREACRHGAEILSIADPIATLDLLGEKMFRSYAPSLLRLLNNLRQACPKTLVVLCGKMSQSLLDTGLCSAKQEPVPEGILYEDVLLSRLLRTAKDETAEIGEIVGQQCLHRLNMPCYSLTLLQL